MRDPRRRESGLGISGRVFDGRYGPGVVSEKGFGSGSENHFHFYNIYKQRKKRH
jgi:hypothetical protein